MLLERTHEKNPALIEAAVRLHQDGRIPAGSWLFDLDAVADNARAIAFEAQRLGLATYFMTKQCGRNPFVTALALHQGLGKTVAVDIVCARLHHRYGLPVGHAGHLNQIPRHDLPALLAMEPEVVTVYSVEAARAVNEAAGALGRVQDLLLRVYRPNDVFFPGQEGGFRDAELLGAARQIQRLPNVAIAGVTSFPVLAYDFSGRQEIAFNPNMRTITDAAARLRDELDIPIRQINAPGNTSTATLAMLREGGATHVEPGHGVLGTTPPMHTDSSHPERPAYVFASEVTHIYEGKAYGIANGGLWSLMGQFLDPDWRIGAFVGREPKAALANRLDYQHLPQIIDYHIPLAPGERATIGDTVVLPIYTQAHMTRAFIVPVSGIASGQPHVWGVFDSAGTMLDDDYNPVPSREVISQIAELLTGYPCDRHSARGQTTP
jgi:predicted amino acid racemase